MLEQRAKELGFTELELDTQATQTAARKLYEKNGYQEYKQDVHDGREFVFYKKLLSQKNVIK